MLENQQKQRRVTMATLRRGVISAVSQVDTVDWKVVFTTSDDGESAEYTFEKSTEDDKKLESLQKLTKSKNVTKLLGKKVLLAFDEDGILIAFGVWYPSDMLIKAYNHSPGEVGDQTKPLKSHQTMLFKSYNL